MIEILKDGDELVGFYRKDKPIGTALMVDDKQMAAEYEKLEADVERLVEAAKDFIDCSTSDFLYAKFKTDLRKALKAVEEGGQ